MHSGVAWPGVPSRGALFVTRRHRKHLGSGGAKRARQAVSRDQRDAKAGLSLRLRRIVFHFELQERVLVIEASSVTSQTSWNRRCTEMMVEGGPRAAGPFQHVEDDLDLGARNSDQRVWNRGSGARADLCVVEARPVAKRLDDPVVTVDAFEGRNHSAGAERWSFGYGMDREASRGNVSRPAVGGPRQSAAASVAASLR